MKVVLFCGGLGLRMRLGEDSVPKPMMSIGYRPALWHIMRYYAHFGHTDFILCLGYGARAVKDYFLNYHETHSNDFVLTKGGEHVELLGSDISEWRITFIDTGIDTAIGERLRRVRKYLDDDEIFLANYGDVLTDAPLNDIIDEVATSDVAGSLLAVPPQDSFHVVDINKDSRITTFTPAAEMNMRINGGYFVLKQDIFEYLNEGEDLVMQACVRAAAGRSHARHPLQRLLGCHGHPERAVVAGGSLPHWSEPLGCLAKRFAFCRSQDCRNRRPRHQRVH